MIMTEAPKLYLCSLDFFALYICYFADFQPHTFIPFHSTLIPY